MMADGLQPTRCNVAYLFYRKKRYITASDTLARKFILSTNRPKRPKRDCLSMLTSQKP